MPGMVQIGGIYYPIAEGEEINHGTLVYIENGEIHAFKDIIVSADPVPGENAEITKQETWRDRPAML